MPEITVATHVLINAMAIGLLVQFLITRGLGRIYATSFISQDLYYLLGTVLGVLAGWIALIVLPQL
jgi:hypothetical protein